MDQELQQLIVKAKKGDQDSFSELIQRYKGKVFRHAFAMVHDQMEAEDITQEAFVKAYFSMDQLKEEYAFSSWLTRIVTNLCYDRIKKREKLPQLQIDPEQTELMADTHSEVENLQLRINLQLAMQKLTPEHRTVIVLRDIQGFSYQEIAEILEIPEGTVKSRINIARKELRKELLRG
ncbi:RNA polymerase sigma factor [Fictibacillus sp. S7]|uniref:RNA polymerase sigma factor n=1 Tax=Fictibacillus sp. S7 TaxID=2212476 RepID=UPI0010128CE4|nr:sigma-70 family RNA polymerase sigma factor [Fictibacillus sp. S7]RXZ00040.1 RNA polymerase subunit sigma-24 [Fictibacillus sp. S7]